MVAAQPVSMYVLSRVVGANSQPIVVPKGTTCVYSPFALQRRSDLFGPTVSDFDPSRWLCWKPAPWTYIPFSGGPRTCLGQHFAMMEMAYVTARMCQTFEKVEERSGKERESQGFRDNMILTPLEGVKVGLIPAIR